MNTFASPIKQTNIRFRGPDLYNMFYKIGKIVPYEELLAIYMQLIVFIHVLRKVLVQLVLCIEIICDLKDILREWVISVPYVIV